MSRRKPILMAPVGDRTMLRAAIDAGADAVYFGIKQLNMRATAKNFELNELAKVVKECHDKNVCAYLTLNTIVYDDESDKVQKILNKAKKAKIDAVICWDFAVIEECRRLKIPFHISTQASVSNFDALQFFSKLGAKAVVLARECSLEQIRDIKKKVEKEKLQIKIEAFVHGAMCVSVSGRCFLSQELFKRSANRGDCLQPCRREYEVDDCGVNKESINVVDKETDDNKLSVANNYILSPKDLCTLPILDKLVDVVDTLGNSKNANPSLKRGNNAGISCVLKNTPRALARGVFDILKIEGRNRSPEYVKTVVESYREAIDASGGGKFDKKLITRLTKKLGTVYNRGFSRGFYEGMPTNDDFAKHYGNTATELKQYVGFVRNYYSKIGVAEVKLETGGLVKDQEIMVQGNKTGVLRTKVGSMELNHRKLINADKGDRVAVKIKKVRPNDKVFVIKKNSPQ